MYTIDGNIIGLTNNQTINPKRYINSKIEQELIEFKQEIEDKYENSEIKNYIFARKSIIRRNDKSQTKSYQANKTNKQNLIHLPDLYF